MRWEPSVGRLGNNWGYVPDYIAVAERAFGGPLPSGAVIHHHDSNRDNPANTNLVICQDQAYHNFIHQRTRAFRATGDPNMRKCTICHTYDLQENLKRVVAAPRTWYRHSRCHAAAELARTKRKAA